MVEKMKFITRNENEADKLEDDLKKELSNSCGVVSFTSNTDRERKIYACKGSVLKLRREGRNNEKVVIRST